ncbi:MAG TPA: hypothetical protein VMQ52_03995 [Candidatus Saccharimonadales bacterium]|jgi:hypothetical protein|nr:hypothetical protein [Candidatus Saccharimonadales bacterium]
MTFFNNKIKSKSDGSGGYESGSIFNTIDQATGADYAIYVTNYSDLNANSLSASATIADLQYDIEQIAQADNAKISNGITTNFKGLSAVSATLTPNNKSDAPTYLIAFLEKHDLYMILVSGGNQSKFNSFTNTFNFKSQ